MHDFAVRLFLVEDQPAWSPEVRSKTTLVQLPKRHLADPALAAALLGIGPDYLLQDLETLGIFFESLVVHDLRIYAQHLRARGVYHLRDMKGREEIDTIVELRDGRWVGVEVKLSHTAVDSAAANLLSIAAKIVPPAAALIVVVPTGPAFQRPDGVWVVPLASLAPKCLRAWAVYRPSPQCCHLVDVIRTRWWHQRDRAVLCAQVTQYLGVLG
nr:DUF4143 domain-containing protein [Corynebacterium renale]